MGGVRIHSFIHPFLHYKACKLRQYMQSSLEMAVVTIQTLNSLQLTQLQTHEAMTRRTGCVVEKKSSRISTRHLEGCFATVATRSFVVVHQAVNGRSFPNDGVKDEDTFFPPCARRPGEAANRLAQRIFGFSS